MFRNLIVLLLLFAAQSCYVTKTIYTRNIFDSWVGASAQQLILQQGSPTRIVSDGEDGQVYIYDNGFTMSTGYSTPGEFYSQPSGLAVAGHQQSRVYYQPGASVSNQFVVTKKVEYFVSKDGYIYSWHATGYPETYEQRYTKRELESGSIDESLFTPPGSKSNFAPGALHAPQINTDIFDSTKYNYSGYKRRKN